MTWKEFKETVDNQMRAANITEDAEIWYIDISFPDEVSVCVDETSGIYIN